MTLEAKLKLDNKTPQTMPLSRSPHFSFLFCLWMMSSCWSLFPPTDENSSWLSVMGWIVPPNSCLPRTYVAKSLQLCLTVQPHRQQPTRLRCPWDSPGKNTGVGCHFLLQCMKVKSESEVTQSCPTPSDSMACSLPGSSIHRIFQARILEWVAIVFSTRNYEYAIIWNRVLQI